MIIKEYLRYERDYRLIFEEGDVVRVYDLILLSSSENYDERSISRSCE